MPEISASRYLVQAGWEHAPHLDEKTKTELLASTPPHLRDARSKGIPVLGSGAIYPVPWEDVSVKPFQIPDYWPRAYALDVGWRRTAALWGAWDPSDWTLYVYAEYYRGQAEPTIHASAIKARGEWIKGVIDPASNGKSQTDGEQLIALYKQNGLAITNADNSVEAGLYECWQGLSVGKIKVFSILGHFEDEYRMYRRDENGKIVKENDHLMDAFRYLVKSGRKVAQVKPVPRPMFNSSPVGDPTAGY